MTGKYEEREMGGMSCNEWTRTGNIGAHPRSLIAFEMNFEA